MRLARSLFIGIAGMLVASCGMMAAATVAGAGREGTYEVSVDRARQVLAAAEAPPMVFGDGPVQFELEKEEPTRLVWSVNKGTTEVMRYTADLAPAGPDGTKVTLSLRGSAAGKLGNVEERLAKSESIRTL